jgi:hypothetical protein
MFSSLDLGDSDGAFDRGLCLVWSLSLPGSSSSSLGKASQHGRSCLSDSKSLGGGLSGGELGGSLVGLLDVTGLLDAVELNVAVGGEVGADATVGSVSSTAAGDGALGHGVGDDALVGVELLGLGVRLEVDEELTDDLDGLLGPSTGLVLELLEHGVSAGGTVEPSEWNNLFVLENVLQVSDGLLQVPALHGAGNFVSVLEVGSEVSNLALGGCKKKS